MGHREGVDKMGVDDKIYCFEVQKEMKVMNIPNKSGKSQRKVNGSLTLFSTTNSVILIFLLPASTHLSLRR